MSILYRLVILTACRSTHHKLAMDALRHVKGPDADDWRSLFLNYYELYLLGAKAPDDEFKDFQNHVLHVRDNYWGGAVRTAQLWYERLVLALRKEYWSDAVYTAGVLSHYFSDPFMPFHTGQTEEEGKVHRAAEWSVTKSYDELQNILEQDMGGYPAVVVPEAPDWLAQMIRRGAELANSHYETLIEHYDLARGAKHPPSGLDQECKDRLAQMLGHATVGFARVLERAFAEARVQPPMVELVVETVLTVAKAPMRWMVGQIENDEQRRQLVCMLEEATRTGKVVQNLPDDEKLVRKLHAQQVLRVPLAELDARATRPTGLKYGRGTVARDRTSSLWTRCFGWEGRLTGGPSTLVATPLRPASAPGLVGANRYASAGVSTEAASRTPLILTGAARRGTTGAASASHSDRGASPPRAGARRRYRPMSRFSRDEYVRRDDERARGDQQEDFQRAAAEEPATDEATTIRPSTSRLGSRSRSANELSGDAAASQSKSDVGTRENSGSGDERPKRGPFWFLRRRKADGDEIDGATELASPKPKRASRENSSAADQHKSDVRERAHAAESSAGEALDDAADAATDEVLESRGRRMRRAVSGAVIGAAATVWGRCTEAAQRVKSAVKRRRKRSDDDDAADEMRPNRLVDSDDADERIGGARRDESRPSGDESDSPATKSARTASLKFYLNGDSPVEDAPTIGPKLAKRLESANVRSVDDLLDADVEKIATKLGIKTITADVVRQWQQQAELVLRVPQLRGHDAQILVACGVTDPVELAAMDPATLFELIEPFLGTREAETYLRGSPKPDLNEVADWIDWAQHARPRQAA